MLRKALHSTKAPRFYRVRLRDLNQLFRRAFDAQQSGHREVCGLVYIENRSFLRFAFLPNRTRRAGKFRLLQSDVECAERRLGAGGRPVVAVFHSHPMTEAVPGPGDLRSAFYRGNALIYDVIGRDARFWRRDERLMTGAREIELRPTVY